MTLKWNDDDTVNITKNELQSILDSQREMDDTVSYLREAVNKQWLVLEKIVSKAIRE